MHPAEMWQRAGRWDVMGEEMFRLRDRKGADLALGMTHEEIFTTLALELSSYRRAAAAVVPVPDQVPRRAAPQGGLMRAREFTMKDSYSFDLDAAGLDASFDLHRARLHADLRPARHPGDRRSRRPAAPWAAPTRPSSCARPRPARTSSSTARRAATPPTSRGDVARCRRSPTRPGLAAPERFDTPGVRTIEDLARGTASPADRQIKTLVYVLDDQLTLVLLRGDHALDEQKLVDAPARSRARPPHPEEIRARSARCPAASARSRVDRTCRSSPTRRCAAAATCSPAPTPTTCTCAASTSNGTSPSARWADLREVDARASPASGAAAAAGGDAGHRGRPHLQARRQATPRPSASTVLDPDGGRVAGRSWAATASASSGRWRRSSRPTTTTGASSGRPRWRRSRSSVVVAQSDDAEVAKAGEDLYTSLSAAGVET